MSCSVTFLILSKLLHSTYRVVDSKFGGLVGWEEGGRNNINTLVRYSIIN